jgi:hypothetical protein
LKKKKEEEEEVGTWLGNLKLHIDRQTYTMFALIYRI